MSPPVVRNHTPPLPPRKTIVAGRTVAFHSARAPLSLVNRVIVPTGVAPFVTAHLDSVPGPTIEIAARSTMARSGMRPSFHLEDANRLFLPFDFDVIEVNRLELLVNSRLREFADDDLGPVILVLSLQA